MYWERLGNILGDFGANFVHFGSKIVTPIIALNTNVLYEYSVFNGHFTVLSVPNDQMTHP